MGTGIGFRLELLGMGWGGSRTAVGVGCFYDGVGEEAVVGSFGSIGIGRQVRLGGCGGHWWHRWVSSGCIVDRNWRLREDYGSVEVIVNGKRGGIAG